MKRKDHAFLITCSLLVVLGMAVPVVMAQAPVPDTAPAATAPAPAVVQPADALMVPPAAAPPDSAQPPKTPPLAAAPAVVPADPTVTETIDDVKATSAAYNSGGILAALLVGLPLFFGLLRRWQILWHLVPDRVKPWAVAGTASVGAYLGVLSQFSGSMPGWMAHLLACLAALTGPAAVGLHQLVWKSLLNKVSPARRAEVEELLGLREQVASQGQAGAAP